MQLYIVYTHKLKLSREYRTLIYNGDVDGCVPFIGDQVRQDFLC